MQAVREDAHGSSVFLVFVNKVFYRKVKSLLVIAKGVTVLISDRLFF
jgi:hypothetical protein